MPTSFQSPVHWRRKFNAVLTKYSHIDAKRAWKNSIKECVCACKAVEAICPMCCFIHNPILCTGCPFLVGFLWETLLISGRYLSFSHYFVTFLWNEKCTKQIFHSSLGLWDTGRSEILSVWGTPRISVIVKAIEKVIYKFVCRIQWRS